MSKHVLGKQRIQEILGQDADAILSSLSEVSPDMTDYIINFAYGEIYMRNGLNDMSREIAAVACLIGQRNLGAPLKAHIAAMLNVGWSQQEIIECFLFLIGYIGFPQVVDAMMIAKEVFKQR